MEELLPLIAESMVALNIPLRTAEEDTSLEDPLLQGMRFPQNSFLVHKAIMQMIEVEWELPEASVRGGQAIARLYPIPLMEELFKTSKVDTLVTAVTKEIIPVEA